MKFLYFFILLLCVGNVSANSTDIITPYKYSGDVLISNEGYLNYHVYTTNNEYVGSIKSSESIFINRSKDYMIYASYDEIRDITETGYIKNKFNQWWLIIIIGIIILGVIAICIKKVIK